MCVLKEPIIYFTENLNTKYGSIYFLKFYIRKTSVLIIFDKRLGDATEIV